MTREKPNLRFRACVGARYIVPSSRDNQPNLPPNDPLGNLATPRSFPRCHPERSEGSAVSFLSVRGPDESFVVFASVCPKRAALRYGMNFDRKTAPATNPANVGKINMNVHPCTFPAVTSNRKEIPLTAQQTISRPLARATDNPFLS